MNRLILTGHMLILVSILEGHGVIVQAVQQYHRVLLIGNILYQPQTYLHHLLFFHKAVLSVAMKENGRELQVQTGLIQITGVAG